MPRSEREVALRKLSQASNLCQNIFEHLKSIYDTYLPVHPEIADSIAALINVLQEYQAMIIEVRNNFP